MSFAPNLSLCNSVGPNRLKNHKKLTYLLKGWMFCAKFPEDIGFLAKQRWNKTSIFGFHCANKTSCCVTSETWYTCAAWENGQEHTMSIFARRMTFFSFYQSDHKNFHGNGLYIGQVFFFWPEKSSIKKNKKQKQSKCGLVMPACRNAFFSVKSMH